MVVAEGTVNALHITRFDQLMVMYDELSVEEDRPRLILSRSPTRRLLRHLSPHMTTFRWLTHLETNDSVHLSTEAIKATLGSWAPEHTQGVVILEGLDAVFDEEGPVPVFALMAWLTELSHLHRLSIHLVLDPLTFPSNVWMRMSPLIASTVKEPLHLKCRPSATSQRSKSNPCGQSSKKSINPSSLNSLPCRN